LHKALEIIRQQLEFVEKQMLTLQNTMHYTQLQWKATKADFVELVYGLSESKCFGDVSLKDIFATLGNVCGCEVKQPARILVDIRNRKREETLGFLGRLQRLLSAKMEKLDEGIRG
jgi:hypothetical protein